MGIQDIFRKNLRALRDSLDKTQGEMAQCIDMDAGTYNRWESGKVWPPPDRVDALAGSLKVESWTLYTDSEKIAKPKPPPTAEEIDATVAHQARKIHALEEEIASLKSDPAYELQRKLVQQKQEFGKVVTELHAKIKELRSQLQEKDQEVVEKDSIIASLSKVSENHSKRYQQDPLVTNTDEDVTYPPELSRVLNYPEILERVLSLIRGWEEQEGLTPSVKKPAQE